VIFAASAAGSGTLDGEVSTEPDAGSHARLARLVREGFDPIWRLLRRLGVPSASAEDAAQEVFLVAARRLAQIEPGSEKSFLYGTALRVAHAHRRRAAREASRTAPFDEGAHPGARGPDDALEIRRQLQALDAALDALDADERVVFVLFELEELTLTEIADVLAIPRGTVASRLRRARTRFLRRASPKKERP
jgi:RNA polymerase sigma-70 factor (ECF subfamily)